MGKEKCLCWLDVGNAAPPAYNTYEERYPEPPPMPAKNPAPLYTLHVELQNIAPPIWRRIVIDGNRTLADLHEVLQIAMGWTNSHLHQYVFPDAFYSDSDFDLDEIDRPLKDESKAEIVKVLKAGDQCFYEYDFGDDWEHRITVEKVETPTVIPLRWATVTDGARACPPEDVGGSWGYEQMLEILRNKPASMEAQEYRDWLGDIFDPEYFDLEETNSLLQEMVTR
ncbi:plasmid pRiA4b ORF-3 family protein [Acidithiobacillus ferrianus]|uniref:plasmid pRiA4b ORF-3 family protein n=1 Tax=Acidithiobacillus ferrianus TaxID=2678518 RepID=UPI0034E42A16